MELLSPAGNIEKLKFAYRFGADAAYIGLSQFSLRAKADNFDPLEASEVRAIKKDKGLYCALNIYFFDEDIERLESSLDSIKAYPFDAFIVSDIGVIDILMRFFPDTELHLSTQANCINSESAKRYRDMGFSRIIPGREMSLRQIENLKRKVPELAIEVFVHGAMCLAYSGRCFLSAWMADRSANRGDCAHSCRWNYRLLEEEERRGEYYPVYEGEGFTSILSSKDLCMIDHLGELRDAGADSLKIEGRMKSTYYTALVTRAYRKHLDLVENKADVSSLGPEELAKYREDLFNVSHRDYSTGFYFGKKDIEIPAGPQYVRNYRFLGSIGKRMPDGSFELSVKNQILSSDTIEYIGPQTHAIEDRDFFLYNAEGNTAYKADHGKVYSIKTDKNIEEGFLLRRRER